MTHFSDTLPGPTLFAYLTDDMLDEVLSDYESTVYRYVCGCSAVRATISTDCYVRWCSFHRPHQSEWIKG